jgi:tripartite-type tricarboxylate transporter receptor subunit TctC
MASLRNDPLGKGMAQILLVAMPSISHIVGEAFAKAAGVQLLHVPYKGNGAALIDLSGGHVKLLFDGLISTAPLARQGKLKMLAISGDKRSPMAPTLPTFAEQGLRDYEAYTWNELMAPAGTPPEVLAKLNTVLNQALALPAVQTRLAQGASDPLGPTTPAQAEAYGRAERARWVPFIRSLRIDNP